MATIAVFGIGDIGQAVLRGLATYPSVTRLWAFSRRAEALQSIRADLAAISYYRGHAIDLQFCNLDLQNLDAVAATLAATQPDVIVNTATLRAWWMPSPLTQADQLKLRLEARLGPWLPVHLALALNLMQARQQAVPHVPVVNLALPDLVNPVLGKLGLAPTCGAGNSEFLAAAIADHIAQQLGVPTPEIQVELVAHHFHCNYFWSGLDAVESLADWPYWLKVFHRQDNITADFGRLALLTEAGRLLPRGRVMAVRTGASAVKNIMRLVWQDLTRTHVCSPGGLGGGCDARLRPDGAEMLRPEGLSATAAQQIETRGLMGDGIQSIEPSGEVRFTPQAIAAFKQVLGYDCPILKPEHAAERATELINCLETYRGSQNR